MKRRRRDGLERGVKRGETPGTYAFESKLLLKGGGIPSPGTSRQSRLFSLDSPQPNL